jgi:hypothetical protein
MLGASGERTPKCLSCLVQFSVKRIGSKQALGA